jgi:hypothetical protein
MTVEEAGVAASIHIPWLGGLALIGASLTILLDDLLQPLLTDCPLETVSLQDQAQTKERTSTPYYSTR